MDFVDDQRPDDRAGICGAKRARGLRGKAFVADAVHMAAEAHVVIRRLKLKPVGITGEISPRIAGVQIHLLAGGTQREARSSAGRGIELRLIERDMAARRDRGRGKAILFRNRSVVRQPPIGDDDRAGSRVVHLDHVGERQHGIGQHFVDHDSRDGARGIVRAGRAADRGARAPFRSVARIGMRRGIFGDERKALAIRRDGPRRSVLVIEIADLTARAREQREPLAAVIEPTGESAIHRDAGITHRKLGRITREDEERIWSERGADREDERDSVGEIQSAEIEHRPADVFEFDELILVAARRAVRQRVVVDFGDDEVVEVLVGVKGRLVHRAPGATVEHACADRP